MSFLFRLFAPKFAVWLVGAVSVVAIVGWVWTQGANFKTRQWSEANQRIDETTLETIQRFDAQTAKDDTRYRELQREISH